MMLLTALAMLFQAAVIPPTLMVRNGAAQPASVPVFVAAKVPSVAAKRLADAMGGTLELKANNRFWLTVRDTRIEFTPGSAFARIDTLVVPLTSAPVLVGNTLYLPFSVVSDVVPRFVTGYLYDGSQGELRGFNTSARKVARTSSSSSRSSAREVATRNAADDSAADTESVAAPAPSKNTTASATPIARRKTKRLVVVDAGHGGPDRGMHGPLGAPTTFYEKTVTLAVAKALRKELEALGLSVLMTRTTDTLIALADRGRIANAAHGDLFVSIHVNAPGGSGAAAKRERGYETYFLAEAKTEDAKRVERMENEAVKFETGVNAPKGDPLSFILNDMAQNEHLRESSELADLIQGGFKKFHPGPSRGVKQANFAVLRGSYMPAVLVEIGFGTHVQEAAYLSDPDNQRDIAKSIAASVKAYLDSYEARLGSQQ